LLKLPVTTAEEFLESGILVLGIDPAQGPAQAAQQAGIPTLCTFFNQDLARQLRAEEGRAADVFLPTTSYACAGSEWVCRRH